MAVVRTAVLLFGFPAGQQLNLRGDRLWYQNYFFGPIYGQAGYWIKQSDAQIVLDGQVFDWAFVDDPNPNLMNRTNAINWAIKAMEDDRDINFDPFDIIILVLGVPPSVQTDGGSTTAKSEDRTHAGIVIRVGDRFDFVAHELGHAIGLNHSYGNPSYKNASWSQPGEYGHPYCIMSASGYGGIGGPFYPASPRDDRPEYSALGPSLNAGSALARGWLNAHVHHLPGAQVDLDLRSRHYLGRGIGITPQALEIIAQDGKNYVIEYRENADWDEGQGSPVLIANAVRGSTADLAHPDTHSATYLGMVRLPINFGGPGSVFNGPGFGIEVLDRNEWTHSLRIRLHPGRVSVTPFSLTSKKELIHEVTVESGLTTWERGERLCMEGTWPYEKLERSEMATFEAVYPLAMPPISVAWTVEGKVLSALGGTLNLPPRQVKVANPKLEDQKGTRWITLRYEIEPLPTGSRLKVFNDPNDETFDTQVSATLTTSIGTGSALDWVEFEGIEYRYPPRFYEEWDECLERFLEIGRRYVRYKVLLEPDLWKRVHDRLVPRVEKYLTLLGQLHEQEEERAYYQVAGDLGRLIGSPSIDLRIQSQEEREMLDHQIVEREPHFFQDETGGSITQPGEITGMPQILGVGGVFLFAQDPELLGEWYARHFGFSFERLDAGDGSVTLFYVLYSRDHLDPDQERQTVFAIMPANEELSMPKNHAMINYRVYGLEALVERLHADGIETSPVNIELDGEGYGKFTRLSDPEGNRIELWEHIGPSPEGS